MTDSTSRSLLGAGFAALSAPMAAGLVALVWQFPVMVAGTSGGSLGAAFAATLSMVMFMSLFSVFAGGVAVGLVGAGAGFLVKGYSAVEPAIAGIFVGVLAALIVAIADLFL